MNDLQRRLRLPPPVTAGQTRLEATAARAAAAGLVDVAYALHESPVGPLVVAATAAGLVAVSFARDGEERSVDDLARRVSPRVLRLPARLDAARCELDEYFAGARRRFEHPVDWTYVTGFSRKVLEAAARIPYGRVDTYRGVATAAGNARAVRAAGRALGSNPVPIVVPCHRVVRTGGGLGGYGGGLEIKEFLLRLEGARPGETAGSGLLA